MLFHRFRNKIYVFFLNSKKRITRATFRSSYGNENSEAVSTLVEKTNTNNDEVKENNLNELNGHPMPSFSENRNPR